MIGVDESPPGVGIIFTLVLVAVLGTAVWRLYSRGYGLRE
jgi:ABC-2 type transport system permease protein